MGQRNWAAAAAVAAAAAAMAGSGLAAVQHEDLVLAISEGSGGTDAGRVLAQYSSVADLIGESIKRKVVVVFVREFGQLEDGMKANRFDFVMARPSDYPARGIRNYGYRYVAHAKPDGQCLIVVPKNSPIKTLDQARGRRWVFPEEAASMTRFCNAELRDQGIDLAQERVSYVGEPASVGQYLEGGFADAGGVASYSGLARDWHKAGHAVLHKSASPPYFPLIAARRIDARQVEAVQKQLLALEDNPGGPELLKSLGIVGFDTGGQRKLSDLLDAIEQK